MPKIRTGLGYVSTVVDVEFTGAEVDENADSEQGDDPDDIPNAEGLRWREGEGHSHAHDEQKGREYEISRGESFPLRVVQEPRRGGALVIHQDHAQHGEPSQHIEGIKTLRSWPLNWRGGIHQKHILRAIGQECLFSLLPFFNDCGLVAVSVDHLRYL